MKNYYGHVLKTSWKFAGTRKPLLVLTYVLFLISNSIYMLDPLIFALFLNRVQQGGNGMLREALLLLAIYASIPFVTWIFHGSGRIIERINSFYIYKNFREYLFGALTSLPLAWHKNHHSGDTMSRVEKSSRSLKRFTDESFQYVETIVKFFFSTVAIFILLPIAGVIAAVFGLVILILIVYFDRSIVPNNIEINEKEHSADSVFYDYITNIRTVVTLRLERLSRKEVVRQIMHILPIWKRNATIVEAKWFTISMVLSVLNFSVIGLFIVHKTSAGEVILFGTLVALYQYTSRLIGVFFNLAWKYKQVVQHSINIHSVDQIIDTFSAQTISSFSSSSLKNWKEIHIHHLTFAYEDAEHHKKTLKGIDLTLRRGENIALVGASGSGKSTLMSIIRGLEDSTKVTVEIDGESFDTTKVLAPTVTLIPQEPEIFENTIKYNVTAGLPGGKKEIDSAIRLAQFSEVLARLPNGLKTDMKEKGVNLSGGEKQRLALARGIFSARNSSIVLLDEPTSSVDPKNEAAIHENIFKAFKKKCVIASVHRLHILPKFDMIYVFKHGKVIGSGNFEDLIKSNEHFQKLWELYLKDVDQEKI